MFDTPPLTQIKRSLRRWLLPRMTLRTYVSLRRLLHPLSLHEFPALNINDVLEVLSAHAVTFVQIGAFDGMSNDPLFAFVRRPNWQGVMVEPVPRHFQALLENCSGVLGLRFKNVGVADVNGELDFYSLPETFTSPPNLQQLGSFERHSIELNLADLPALRSCIVAEKIRVIRLVDLFDEFGIQSLDLLCLDVEGMEYRVLKSLPESRITPRVILFEWGSMKETECRSLIELLVDLGYSLFKCGGDMVALHKSDLD